MRNISPSNWYHISTKILIILVVFFKDFNFIFWNYLRMIFVNMIWEGFIRSIKSLNLTSKLLPIELIFGTNSKIIKSLLLQSYSRRVKKITNYSHIYLFTIIVELLWKSNHWYWDFIVFNHNMSYEINLKSSIFPPLFKYNFRSISEML